MRLGPTRVLGRGGAVGGRPNPSSTSLMIRYRFFNTLVGSALIALLPAVVTSDLGAQERWRTDFTKRTIDLDELISGGPPKDGIPAIDDPRFISVDEAARWLERREPVAVVTLGGATHVYPLQVMIWHEIVNDEVGGIPVSVTYCPLCNTMLAFDRRFDGRVLDFGTTGRLRFSDLVMYDRQTESWWQQATGEGIIGAYAGERLIFIPSPILSWSEARRAHPDARVLSRDTGHVRDYGRNPYEGYDRGGPLRWAFPRRADTRLGPMERVAAIEVGDESIAVPFEALALEKVVRTEVGGVEVVVFWTSGTASALDAGALAEGRDIGSTNVFRTAVGDRSLEFEPADDGRFRDRQTGSLWDMSGRAVGGELAGQQLEAIPHGNHFWFAWAVFKPETRIVRY